MINFECLLELESEEHVVAKCPAYHPLRVALSENLKSQLMLKEYELIMPSFHKEEFGRYLDDCYKFRNPKDFSKP